ncbi:MarR family EPS-associated transcriptional regulator [Amylibacter sp.]|nr:MarR family EPS-associated transcriptional regulator [Amylibacter sp.]
MVSCRKEHQEYAKLRVFQIISKNPQLTSREVAQKLRISNGSAYYLLISLIEKGYLKLSSFKDNSQKSKYAYLLTPKGIREKSLLTSSFLKRKKKEYLELRDEIHILEKQIGIDDDNLDAENK